MKGVSSVKRWLVCLLLGFLFLIGCGDSLKGVESSYAIKVSGSENLTFSGHYTFVGTSEIPKPVNAEGKVPAEYTGKGVAAVCVIRKTEAGGTLKVEITQGDKVIATSETAEPYGIISLGKIPEKTSIINQILGKILG
jgi:hypothetical protein